MSLPRAHPNSPETHVVEPAAPLLGGQGAPPQLPGGSVPHKTEPDPCPQTLETMKGSMRVRPAPWGGGPLNPNLD